MGRCLKSPQVPRASCLCLSPFTGNVPQGVFCETISQKTRECRGKIMQGRISVHREAGCYERSEQ